MRVIAGASHGVDGAMQREVTEPLYLDLELPAGASFAQALPAAHNAFVYVYRGGVQRRRHATCRCSAWRSSPTTPAATASCCTAPAASRVLLIAGKPLNEPIAQYGPFVMNSEAEILQAVHDYQAGKFAGVRLMRAAAVDRDRVVARVTGAR